MKYPENSRVSENRRRKQSEDDSLPQRKDVLTGETAQTGPFSSGWMFSDDFDREEAEEPLSLALRRLPQPEPRPEIPERPQNWRPAQAGCDVVQQQPPRTIFHSSALPPRRPPRPKNWDMPGDANVIQIKTSNEQIDSRGSRLTTFQGKHPR